MKDSIVIDMKYAGYDMIDGTPNVHRHHIFEGNMSVHRNKEMSALMHIIGQLAWEKHYIVEHEDVNEDDARDTFRKRYGKSYL